MKELSKKKYFNYDSKELLGVMRFDFYDSALANQWNPRDLIIELEGNRFKEATTRIKLHSI